MIMNVPTQDQINQINNNLTVKFDNGKLLYKDTDGVWKELNMMPDLDYSQMQVHESVGSTSKFTEYTIPSDGIVYFDSTGAYPNIIVYIDAYLNGTKIYPSNGYNFYVKKDDIIKFASSGGGVKLLSIYIPYA